MSGLDAKGTYFPNGVNVPEGKLFVAGTAVTPDAAELNKLDGVTATTAELNKTAGATYNVADLNKLAGHFTVTALDGSDGKKACSTNGVSAITGGEGISDMTLAAPSPGDVATIRIDTLSSGSVVVTTAAGVTFNGTNNTATFDAVGETLVLAYKTATAWQVVLNIGGVAFSTVS